MKKFNLKYKEYDQLVCGPVYRGDRITLCAGEVHSLFSIPTGTKSITMTLTKSERAKAYEMTSVRESYKGFFGTYYETNDKLGLTTLCFLYRTQGVFRKAVRDGYRWIECDYEC